MIKNININKLKKIVKESAFILITGVTIGATTYSCTKNLNNTENTTIETTVDNNEPTTETPEETTPNVQEPTTEIPEETTSEVVIKLDIDNFNKMVDEVEKANKEAGLNLKRENLELTYYINNKQFATPKLIKKIESSYEYNEASMLNTYIQTIVAYCNDKTECYNGLDEKCSDISLLFIDKVDKATIQKIISSFDETNANVKELKRNVLDMETIFEMAKVIMAKNKELGIQLSREEIIIAICKLNYKQATEVTRKYAELNVPEGKTLESVTNDVLNIYKAYNKKSRTDFDISLLEYETTCVQKMVDNLYEYFIGTGTINDYPRGQLSPGGNATAKLVTDMLNRIVATTGYATTSREKINTIAGANTSYVIDDIYTTLGFEESQVNCETAKVNVHTAE